MRQNKLPTRSALLSLLALLIFVTSALVSHYVPNASAQFIDRITRPCAAGGSASLVQTQTLNVLINTCTGGQIIVNGVPLVITPGGGLGDPGANGVVVRTALNTTVARTLTVSSPLTISNGTGVAGNPLIACATCVTAAGTLTSTALMTGAGTKAAQTPSATATLQANGDISTPGSVTTGNGGGANGALDLLGLTSGTVTVTVNAVAGTWTFTLPTTDGGAGEFLQTNGSGVTTWAVVPAGVTANATVGTIPYLSAANVYSDSPFTRLSASHVQLFAGGVGGFDFDSSTPAITINSGGGIFSAGDINFLGNGVVLSLNDGSNQVSLASDQNGSNQEVALDGGTNTAQVHAASANIYARGTVANGILNIELNSGVNTSLTLDEFNSIITLTSPLTVLTGELTAPKTIRTGTASNTDVAGTLTVGGGGTITYTFTQTYATAPVCVSSDQDAAPNITGASASTTTLTVTGSVGHVIGYQCIGLN